MNELLYLGSAARIAALIFIGIPIVRTISNFFSALCKQRISPHSGMLAGHIVFYSGLVCISATILHECGFNITALLGAAGVLGVAIGFASQTSISNIISGFFLLLERPFSKGDIIKSGDVSGMVESIDLLSIRIRTLDNTLVRLPNETVLKQHLANLTYYPIRRIDLILSTNYAQDSQISSTIAQKAITKHSLFLTNPAPVIMINKITHFDCIPEIRVFLTVRVWVAKEHFSSAPALLMNELKKEFDQNNSTITITHIN